ncbi:MAG: hypothetical protein C0501_05955 [Isosphaera sp.]|nr:hypothetical protein [Isosphaera sp.]
MTDVRGGVELGPDAEARLGGYLADVRAAVAGLPGVSPDEIEADVREHVGHELRDAPRPVPAAALEAVLARLGPPAGWAAGERPDRLRRVGLAVQQWARGARASVGARLRAAREAVWNGPDDWRLAYLTFGVFAVGVLTVIAFPVCLVVSYLLGRAGAAAAREKGVELGAARKWLLYPPAVVVSGVLLVAVVGLPLAAGGWAWDRVDTAVHRVALFDGPDPPPADPRDRQAVREWQERQASRQALRQRKAPQLEDDRRLLAVVPVDPRWAPAAAGAFVGVGAGALWWGLFGVAGGLFPGAVRGVFFPLAGRFRARYGWVLAVLCAGALAAWGAAAYELAGR